MKASLIKIAMTVILLSQSHAFAIGTTISDIKDENITCFNISTVKTDAFVFKTTAKPYKIWKAQLDAEGKLKTKKAFLLRDFEIIQDAEEGYLKGFSADLTATHKFAGTFSRQLDEDFLLTVISTKDEDKGGSEISRYNCQLSKSSESN